MMKFGTNLDGIDRNDFPYKIIVRRLYIIYI